MTHNTVIRAIEITARRVRLYGHMQGNKRVLLAQRSYKASDRVRSMGAWEIYNFVYTGV